MERRRLQRWREAWNRPPEIIALRRAIAARHQYQQRHPFSGRHPGLLRMHCIFSGIEQGGATAECATLYQAAREQIVLELASPWHGSLLPL
jgi:hypothetical protein